MSKIFMYHLYVTLEEQKQIFYSCQLFLFPLFNSNYKNIGKLSFGEH